MLADEVVQNGNLSILEKKVKRSTARKAACGEIVTLETVGMRDNYSLFLIKFLGDVKQRLK